jgi:RimJ/RimL family protein N-acetyltransferase
MRRRGFTVKHRSLDIRPHRPVRGWLSTSRLELVPLDPGAAAALPEDRHAAAQIIGTDLAEEWPQPDLLGILPKQVVAGPRRAQFGIWLVIERETSSVIGDAGFHGPPSPQATLEIGYCIIPSRRRRGYATEASRALIAWALEQPGVEAVVAGCDVANEPSIRTLERLGFLRTGQDDSELRWRI